jgi:hypothetical protein
MELEGSAVSLALLGLQILALGASYVYYSIMNKKSEKLYWERVDAESADTIEPTEAAEADDSGK